MHSEAEVDLPYLCSPILHRSGGGVIAGNVEMCKLLHCHNARLDCKDKEGQFLLHYALCRIPINESLIHFAAYPLKPLMDEKDNDGKTPLDYAIENNANLNFVFLLLLVPDQRQSYFKKLPHPLQFYLCEYLRLVKELIILRHLVRDLVAEGADPFEPDDEGNILLHHLVGSGPCMLIQQLIDKNKEKASAGYKYGINILHVAAFLGRKVLCELLLWHNIEMIDTKDRDGQSAIFYSVAGPHDDPDVLAKFILKIFIKDFSQATPLHVATDRGNLKMVEKLLSPILEEQRKKAYVEAQDVLGQTTLHRAASGGHVDIVKKLLDSGAHTLKQRDCNGKTTLQFAGQADDQNAMKIAKLLLNKCELDEEKSFLCLILQLESVYPILHLRNILNEKEDK